MSSTMTAMDWLDNDRNAARRDIARLGLEEAAAYNAGLYADDKATREIMGEEMPDLTEDDFLEALTELANA